jgi:rhodanese-related sulfurtransferase
VFGFFYLAAMIRWLILCLLLGACGAPENKNAVLAPADFQRQLASTTDAILVDVRRPQELAAGMLPGARNFVFGSPDFEQQIVTLEKKPIYIYCASGIRSGKAAKFLRAQGYEVFELEGGLRNWTAAGLPLAPAP